MSLLDFWLPSTALIQLFIEIIPGLHEVVFPRCDFGNYFHGSHQKPLELCCLSLQRMRKNSLRWVSILLGAFKANQLIIVNFLHLALHSPRFFLGPGKPPQIEILLNSALHLCSIASSPASLAWAEELWQTTSKDVTNFSPTRVNYATRWKQEIVERSCFSPFWIHFMVVFGVRLATKTKGMEEVISNIRCRDFYGSLHRIFGCSMKSFPRKLGA